MRAMGLVLPGGTGTELCFPGSWQDAGWHLHVGQSDPEEERGHSEAENTTLFSFFLFGGLE